MKLIIYINENFEEERALFDLDSGVEILKGDYYHDKIDETIGGYLKALKDFDIYKADVEQELIDESHALYIKLNFCGG